MPPSNSKRLVQNFMLVQKFVVTNWQVKLTPVLKLFSSFLNEKLSSPFTKLHHSFADIHTNQLHTIVNKNCWIKAAIPQWQVKKWYIGMENCSICGRLTIRNPSCVLKVLCLKKEFPKPLPIETSCFAIVWSGELCKLVGYSFMNWYWCQCLMSHRNFSLGFMQEV